MHSHGAVCNIIAGFSTQRRVYVPDHLDGNFDVIQINGLVNTFGEGTVGELIPLINGDTAAKLDVKQDNEILVTT